jgi:hypothetical protein
MATTISEIPLRASSQTFTISLASVIYKMRVQWRDKAQEWIVDLSDQDDNLLIAGVPLLPGADILGQYPELGVGGELWVASDGAPDEPPTFAGLGSTHHLYFVARS